MSHRPADNYEFVATEAIDLGGVRAFNMGDPVPGSTVDENGLDDMVVRRDEWDDRPQDEPARAMKRGEMPPHLQDRTAEGASTDKPVARKATAAKKTDS